MKNAKAIVWICCGFLVLILAACGGGDAAPTLPPTMEPTPTMELPPTTVNSQMKIVDIIGIGDITAEGILIQNNGNIVDIGGWTLSDGDDNIYIFPENHRLFSGAGITIYTRVGDNTPSVLFLGRDEAVLSSGDMVVLTDQDGNVQDSQYIP